LPLDARRCIRAPTFPPLIQDYATMAKMQANQMRAGMVIEFEGQRYTIIRQNIM